MSLLEAMGISAKSEDDRLEAALVAAADRVIDAISIPGLIDRQVIELRGIIRDALRKDDAKGIKAAFSLAVERVQDITRAEVEVARLKAELREIAELELPAANFHDPVSMLTRCLVREQIEERDNAMSEGKASLADAEAILSELRAAPLIHRPEPTVEPQPWPRKVVYPQHRGFEPEPELDEGWPEPNTEFTDPFTRSRDLPRV